MGIIKLVQFTSQSTQINNVPRNYGQAQLNLNFSFKVPKNFNFSSRMEIIIIFKKKKMKILNKTKDITFVK